MKVFSLRLSLETNAHRNPHIYGRWVIGHIVVFASFNVLFRLILLLLLRSTPTIELTFPNDLSDFGPSPNYSSLMFVQFDELRSYDINLFAHFHRVMMSSNCPTEMDSRLKIASISWIIWANWVDSYSDIKWLADWIVEVLRWNHSTFSRIVESDQMLCKIYIIPKRVGYP